jgi:SOS-response transcriptional repressor LexA
VCGNDHPDHFDNRSPLDMSSANASRHPIIRLRADDTPHDCSSGESFALMVLGDSMCPEFNEGDIVVIEPEGLATDGSYVLAWHADEWIFRQLQRAETGWILSALNPAYAPLQLADLTSIRGVIIQKSRPGRRRQSKRYAE